MSKNFPAGRLSSEQTDGSAAPSKSAAIAMMDPDGNHQAVVTGFHQQDTGITTTGALTVIDASAQPVTKINVYAKRTAGSTNEITFQIQYSPDNSNWIDLGAAQTSVSGEASHAEIDKVVARYVRVNVTTLAGDTYKTEVTCV